MNIRELLQTAPIFSCFDQSQLRALEQAFSVQTFNEGHEFTREGERNRTMYLIVEGEVMVTRNRRDTAGFELVKILGTGQIFGLITLLDKGYCTASCRALGDVKVASLPSEAFDVLMHNNAAIARNFQTVIVRQLTHDFHIADSTLIGMIESGDAKDIRRIAEIRSVL